MREQDCSWRSRLASCCGLPPDSDLLIVGVVRCQTRWAWVSPPRGTPLPFVW